MYFIGIDGGLDGGISVLKGNNVFGIHDIPTIEERLKPTTRMRRKARIMDREPKDRKRHKYNINALIEIFKTIPVGDCFAALEFAQAMPDQAATAQMSIGFGFGLYQGILSAQYIRYEIIHPKKWQKEFSISGDTKAQAFQTATHLFPRVKFTTERGRVLTGRCDSILLAEYARRKYKNKLSIQ